MPTKVLYWVSSDGTIVRMEAHVSPESAQRDPVFANSLSPSSVVGRNIFEFIQGREVQHLYAIFHEKVLKDRRHIVFDYRCDGPSIRREMRMSLSPEAELVRYESIVLQETPRAREIPAVSPSAEVFVPICSICKRYRYPSGSNEWKELDLMPAEPELPSAFDFTHGLCPDCFESAMAQVRGRNACAESAGMNLREKCGEPASIPFRDAAATSVDD